MIGILFIVLSLFAGFCLVQKILPSFTFSEKIAGGWLVGTLLSAISCFSLCWLLGYSLGIILTTILLIICSVLYFPKKVTVQKEWLLLIFLGGWLTIFSVLFSKSLLAPTSSGWYTLEYSFGDLALHSTYANYFAEQTVFSLTSPIFSAEDIHYPVLINFHTSILLRLGLSLHMALLISSLATCVSVLVLLYHISYNITQKSITPFLASALFFFNGGTGAWQHLSSFFSGLPFDPTNDFDNYIFWTNVITTHIMPQRGFLIGLAVVLLFLRIWHFTWQQKYISTIHILSVSTLVGLTPLFHGHSFLVLLPLLGWLLGWAVITKKITLKQLIASLAVCLSLAVPQLLLLSGENTQSFIALQLGWNMADKNWLIFWWQNMGLYLVFLLAAPFLFRKNYPTQEFFKHLAVPFISIFILCNIFIFQPYDWDNMKFFMFVHLYIAICTAAVMSYFWKSLAQKSLIVATVLVSCLSGVGSIVYVNQNHWQIISNAELAAAEKIKKQTDPQSIFITADSHNHLVPMLAGRAVVRGYSGWLSSHGIDYLQTDTDIREIYAGSESALELIKQHQVDYIFVGPKERMQYSINQDFLKKMFMAQQLDDQTVIYKISN